MGGDQPMTGILKGHNLYELLVDVNGSLHIVYKHAIHSIQIMDVVAYNASVARSDGKRTGWTS